MTYVPRLLPGADPGTLPVCTPEINPDLLLLFVDVGVDYLTGFVASIATLIVAHEQGIETHRHHAVCVPSVPCTDSTSELSLLAEFTLRLSESVQGVGRVSCPLHIAYYDELAPLLEAARRHFAVPAIAALYDFLTLAESPRHREAHGLTRLASEVERYSHTATFPSLQHIAGQLGYRWQPRLRRQFREGFFDGITQDDGRFFQGKARGSSKMPIEYYYAAWGSLPPKPDEIHDGFAPYRNVVLSDIDALLRAKLDAMYHIYSSWNNAQTANWRLRKPNVDLDKILLPSGEEVTLADALAVFLSVERMNRLMQWKSERRPPPERRVLSGDTLMGVYNDTDQYDETQERNRKNKGALTRDEKWDQDGLVVRLRLCLSNTDCAPDEANALLLISKLMVGDRVVVSPLYSADERLPLQNRHLNQVSAEQLLYAARAEIVKIEPDTHGDYFVWIVMRESIAQVEGYLFSSAFARPFEDGMVLAIDPDPNDGFGQQQSAMMRDIRFTLDGSKPSHHTLYHWLSRLQAAEEWDEQEEKERVGLWSDSARKAQSLYFAGLRKAHRLGILAEEYDDEDAGFIGAFGPDTSRFVVAHGPPGSGKSLRASHAVFARLQGALADEQQLRVLISAPTHAATDALLRKVWSTQRALARLVEVVPALGHYFDRRLLKVPLFRIAPHGDVSDGVTALPKARNKGNRDDIANADRILEHRHAIVAGTPGGIYGMYKSDRWLRQRFHAKRHADLLILDEAARMSIPEALMSSIPLARTGQILLCGDNMQFAPIHARNWQEGNPPRIPLIYGAYKSVFDFLREHPQVPQVRFSRTHRCHVKIADFLKATVYQSQDIPLFSTITATIPVVESKDPFVAAVLAPAHSLVLVVHDESRSERINRFEADLLAPVLDSVGELNDAGATISVGIVAAHRAQRSLLLSRFPQFAGGIGTVDSMQGAEFDVSVLSCTESDSDYIASADGFAHSLARLNVAISRARLKAVMVASRAVLSTLGTEITPGFLAYQALRRTCNRLLWSGERDGHRVEIWGN